MVIAGPTPDRLFSYGGRMLLSRDEAMFRARHRMRAIALWTKPDAGVNSVSLPAGLNQWCPMFTRRIAMITLGASTLSLTPPGRFRHAFAQAGDQAVAFVKTTSDRLVAIVNSPGAPPEKRRQLEQVVDSTVDVDDIGHFCLGRFWRLATPEQQKQYMELFRNLLVTKVVGHLGEYQGVRVTMGLARANEDTEIVITTVERPRTPTMQVDWVISTASGHPKIIDLLAGGTSLRLTQSADFAAYLAQHQYNVHELLEGMQQAVEQSK
jgi:phospholipid transport system substrate-binding protein